MPTYEYRCKKCRKIFEESQSMTAKPLTRCRRPQCGGRLERLIGAGAGLIFKGSGFYVTDYKKSTPSSDKSEKPAAKHAAAPKETKKDPPSKKPGKD